MERRLRTEFLVSVLLILLCCSVRVQAREEILYDADASGNACITYVPESWTDVEIPERIDGHPVTALSEGLFAGRNKLTRVVLPDTVKIVPERCFADCVRLQEVTFGAGTEEIGREAFASCRLLRSAELPKYVRMIGARAFEGTALERIELPEGLTALGAEAFSDCEGLREIVMRRRLRDIDEEAFSGCGAKLRVEYGSAAEEILAARGMTYEYAFRETNGWVYMHTETGAELLGRRTAPECVEVPFVLNGARVCALGAGAFQAEEGIREVRLSNTVRVIGDWAFSYCPMLETVVLNGGLEEIGADAFRECGALKCVEIPASVTKIGERAFEGCEGLVLRVHIGSAAERYARENGIPTEIIGE